MVKREGVKLRRAICVWQSAPPSWSGAIPMPISRSAPGETSNSAHRLGRIIGTFAADRRRPRARGPLWPLLDLALRVRHQEQRQRGQGLFAARPRWSVSAKARPGHLGFGCKVSIVTPVTAPKGGQFVLHAKALHGNPYDGHTLGRIAILKSSQVPRCAASMATRAIAVRAIRPVRVWISGQVRRVTKAIGREMRAARSRARDGHLKDDIGCGATISKAEMVIASMPCSPRPATTSACSGAGSRIFCASCYRSSVIAGRRRSPDRPSRRSSRTFPMSSV